MNNKQVTVQETGGCGGCVFTIIFFFLVWVLIFGITIGGTYYTVGCDTEKGVVIDENPS